MIDHSRYHAIIFWSDEDQGFVAEAPDLPGCCAIGDNQQEALAELQDAILAWIEAAADQGHRPAGDKAINPRQPI